MATIKSYTDLEQSKKLAEILSLDSADMHYSKDFDGSWFVGLAEYISVKIPKYVGNIEEHLLPCWSLAALLSVVPEEVSLNSFKDGNWNAMVQQNGKMIYSDANNSVDACYELILKLHEQNLI